MEKDCRICLDGFKCLTVFKDLFDEQNAHLLRQIHSITGLQIKNIKGYPRHICNICLMDLGCAIEFRERCFISQKQFIEEINAVDDFCDAIEVKNDAHNDMGEEDPLVWDLIEEVDDTAEDTRLMKEEDIDSQIEYFFTTTEEFKHNDVAESAEQTQAIDPNAFDDEYEEKSTLDLRTEATDFQAASKPITVAARSVGPFVCDECGKSINNISNFREHKLRHTGIKSFICKHCRKCFATHKELIRHVRIHTGERPYTCRYCPSRFADLGTIRQHERRHINSRPFECSECGKSFFSSSCLSKHRLIHKALPRTHHCEICDVWFQRLDHLHAHMRCRSHKEKTQARG